MPHITPIALTIAGSDSSGGAGIQADLKTFSALGVYGCSAITCLTAQNTRGVQEVLPVNADFIQAQVRSVMTDLKVGAIKTGMLGTAEIILAVVEALKPYGAIPLVVDPVMVATSGDRLLADDAIDTLIAQLLPRATLVTPNLPEAATLLGEPVATSRAAIEHQARALLDLGARAVLMKGGHGDSAEATDVLVSRDDQRVYSAPRIATRHTHGTGCTLASAIAAGLAQGLALADAVGQAKDYLHGAISHADELAVGEGAGPVHHFYQFPR
ncbi:bifunctional hydroxymethylpyrimidine kinase/phosphomethylpyrimidine kinase [Marinimicrobium alkaliphilum]|uniref:bifunctional hydroxymethylpyrimidine kinase/phosphomethylpyrimidine kinase n=1 Tax=Marinimicrobium alkaliphilum TaxID=2202654 RepID=UPI000DB9E507|nr:bifunctional hydroxymethylpyrimidine kinase/phosphomethylpyrimidine kinase [Marinimicrobium alkaliphilum]